MPNLDVAFEYHDQPGRQTPTPTPTPPAEKTGLEQHLEAAEAAAQGGMIYNPRQPGDVVMYRGVKKYLDGDMEGAKADLMEAKRAGISGGFDLDVEIDRINREQKALAKRM